MSKRNIFLILVALVFFLNGCGTIKGAAVGTGAAAWSLAGGIKEDYDTAKKVDNWMQKNLW
jgi:uncharacterized protein YceK